MFVERKAGIIVGVYTPRQPGQAEEELPADNPEILAFQASKPSPKVLTFDAIATLLKTKLLVTQAEIDAAKV